MTCTRSLLSLPWQASFLSLVWWTIRENTKFINVENCNGRILQTDLIVHLFINVRNQFQTPWDYIHLLLFFVLFRS